MTDPSHLAVPSLKRTSAVDVKPAVPGTGGHVIGPSKKAKLKPSNEIAQLRPYQVRIIDACLQAVRQDGFTRIGVSAPTGSGKTTVFVKLIEELILNHDDKVLILTNSEVTASQAVAQTKMTLGMKAGISIGLEKADQKSDSADNVIITTWQTLSRPDRMAAFFSRHDVADFVMVIVDEAHHSAADSYLRLLSMFNHKACADKSSKTFLPPVRHENEVPIVGFSATFARNDEKQLLWVFEEVVLHITTDELVKDGFLAPVHVVNSHDEPRFRDEFDRKCRLQQLVAIHSPKADGKEYDGEKLSCRGLLEELPIRTFSQSVVEAYKEGAVGRKSTVVFAANLDDVGSILQAFTDAGIDAKDVSSDNTVHERDSTLKSFRKGDLAVLVNCRVLMEGCDLPAVDCVILARTTKSAIDYNQMLGRGMRLADGKDGLKVLDLLGSSAHLEIGVEPRLD